MAIEFKELKVSTVGSAGSATGSSVLSVPLSELLAVYLDFHSSAPSSTDTTVTLIGNPASLVVLTESNSATDVWRYPKTQDHDNVGSAITGSYSAPVIHGRHIQIDLAQCNGLTNALVATLMIRR